MLANVKIHHPAGGGSNTRIEVDGVDFAGVCRSLSINMGPDSYIPEVQVEFAAQLVEFDGLADARLIVAPDVEAAMLAAGWTPGSQR